jgi:oxygen-independent coproporphyrinogen-3 oxidase
MLSLYVHIPFCERKCAYCDFYSVEQKAMIPRFLQALSLEIEARAPALGGLPVDTIFFGGGTPSLLRVEDLRDVLDHLRRVFVVLPSAEITVEVNPGTMSGAQASAYRLMGVNRLSIGVQSFDPDELHFLGRIHTADEAVECVTAAREAEIQSVSIDLMYALPGQRHERWLQTLERAVGLAPDHISAYSLIVEDGTPLARWVRAGRVVPADPETEAQLYEITMATLRGHGYEQYEVSNYALPGHRSRHNSKYWTHGPYCGFGPSAHSFVNSGSAHRSWNVGALLSYCERLERGELPTAGEETVTRDQLVHERIFLGLRSGGLDLGALRRDLGHSFGPAARSVLRQLESDSMLTVEDEVVCLTEKGYLMCDEIAVRLMVP